MILSVSETWGDCTYAKRRTSIPHERSELRSLHNYASNLRSSEKDIDNEIIIVAAESWRYCAAELSQLRIFEIDKLAREIRRHAAYHSPEWRRTPPLVCAVFNDIFAYIRGRTMEMSKLSTDVDGRLSSGTYQTAENNMIKKTDVISSHLTSQSLRNSTEDWKRCRVSVRGNWRVSHAIYIHPDSGEFRNR